MSNSGPNRYHKSKKAHKDRKHKHMTRAQALAKLQLSLQDFRKLCILKGIYPREPKKKFKGSNTTYFLRKDILYMLHDPLIDKFRERRTFAKRVKKAKAKKDKRKMIRLQHLTPRYTLDHVIKDRYPTFLDAVRDLDDAICTLFLFANLPQTDKVRTKRLQKARQLTLEFQHYIVYKHALKKCFISIKGIYYQAEIQGEKITWLVPYEFSQSVPRDVDFRVMSTFLEFYQTFVGFVLFKLYSMVGLYYPPKIDGTMVNDGEGLGALIVEEKGASKRKKQAAARMEIDKEQEEEITSSISEEVTKKTQDKLQQIKIQEILQNSALEQDEEGEDEGEATKDDDDQDDEEEEENTSLLFSGLHIFLEREVPVRSLEFVIRAMGGRVSWEGCASGVEASDQSITHHIMDRPKQGHKFLTRQYIQPQWVYDSVNEATLLPDHQYVPGATLPAHLSPFVDDEEVGYVPARRKELLQLIEGETKPNSVVVEEPLTEADKLREREEEYAKGLNEELGVAVSGQKRKRAEVEQGKFDEDKEASVLLSRKKKRLYDKIKYREQKMQESADKLMQKRKKVKGR